MEPFTSLFSFLQRSPSPFHAVHTASEQLRAANFIEIDQKDDWANAPRRGFTYRGGAIVAWVTPKNVKPNSPVRIIGAHTDSPNLRLKPEPDVSSVGWRQLGVEVYGGILSNSWLDRDLGLSGRVVLADGATRLALIDRPLARVAQLAIHLDREVNDKGLVLDKQQHLTPLWGLSHDTATPFREWLATEIGASTDEIVAGDLMFHDLTPPTLLGVDNEFIASARIDNLFSAWCAIQALLAVESEKVDAITMVALFDHEEVGSDSTTGAGGPILESTLARLCGAFGVDQHRSVAGSTCLSADMAHAVHPNYVDRHEPGHRPVPNGGPVLKINASQRYATDATTAAVFRAACERAKVPMQLFVSRNNMPCGSTIGPITATRLGIATVDVGCAQLSMHSARELCGAKDVDYFLRALRSYLAGPGS